ncbi:MAG: 3'-5' exonuclease [Deltaproteobacteria bacterium]|nr:3'-5' exonuclease [Deltaproteobacteria bacterium]
MIQSVNRQERYVVLDVETTGLSPWKGDRVIEIGAVALEGGTLMAEFNTLIQIPREIPVRASQIHGITDEMLIGQPTPEEVFPALEAFIRDSILVAHNARFDLGFLRREYELLGTRFHRPHVCTLEMSRSRFPHLRNHKLETVYRHLGSDTATNGDMMRKPEGSASCPRKQTHRALDDARMVARIWLAMEER